MMLVVRHRLPLLVPAVRGGGASAGACGCGRRAPLYTATSTQGSNLRRAGHLGPKERGQGLLPRPQRRGLGSSSSADGGPPPPGAAPPPAQQQTPLPVSAPDKP